MVYSYRIIVQSTLPQAGVHPAPPSGRPDSGESTGGGGVGTQQCRVLTRAGRKLSSDDWTEKFTAEAQRTLREMKKLAASASPR